MQYCFLFTPGAFCSHQVLHNKAARHEHARCVSRYGGVMAYPPFSIALDGEPDMVYISDGITPFSITARVHDIAGNLVTAGMPLLLVAVDFSCPCNHRFCMSDHVQCTYLHYIILLKSCGRHACLCMYRHIHIRGYVHICTHVCTGVLLKSSAATL